MFKFQHTTLVISLLFACLTTNGQQTVVVKKFDYIWGSGMSTTTGKRIIIPADDSTNLLIKNSFARAFHQRWNIDLPEVLFSVKPLPFLSYTAKFNTKLKDTEAGKWYLFLQLFDKGGYSNRYNDQHIFSTSLELRCKLVNHNDSVLIERDLIVNIYYEQPPSDQVILIRLPAYPASFIASVDSIAEWLFQREAIGVRSIHLKPACVFQASVIKDKPLSNMNFKSDNENIQSLSAPTFAFNTPPPTYKRTGAKRNAGGNSLSGALTLFTGIGTGKNRLFEYNADFIFKDGDSTYDCFIKYAEQESADRERQHNSDGSFSTKSTNYALSARFIDPSDLNAITLGKDTLATFNITYENTLKNNYSKMWNGSDSSTITALPTDWKNTDEEVNVLISGTIEGNSFAMKTSNNRKNKQFYINDQLVTIIHGDELPVNGALFHPISLRQLKFFTILSSLPYAYFNVHQSKW